MARSGNPNPDTSGLKPAKKGEVRNPGGKTSEQKKTEMRNAEKAMALREMMLDAMLEKARSGEVVNNDEILKMMDAQGLKMLKDAEDRGLGAPTQPIISPDGSMTPNTIQLVAQPIKNDDSTD